MNMETNQTEFWNSEFGADYTERSILDPGQLDEYYMNLYGSTRTEMNREFLSDVPVESMLEVGCNVGNQLRKLQEMGFQNLFGIELQSYAVERGKALTSGINIIRGSAFDIPFKDNYFDLVYTSGVLIHISPDDVFQAMDEMYRTSRKYIWGLEYYADEFEEITYRGNKSVLWKSNYQQMFLDRFPNLKLVKAHKYKYVGSDNVDMMYLLEKN
jgi:pseudaminic acid biosynthesis-associated methylase